MINAKDNLVFVPYPRFLINNGIYRWVVWCGCWLINSKQGIQMHQNFIFKWPAFVTMYVSWNTIDVEPFVQNYICWHIKSILIWYYKCLAKLEKGISQDKDIFLIISWMVHFGKIDTGKAQWSVVNNRTRFCFSTYIMTLCYLAPWTVFHIFWYILISFQ